MAANHSYYPPNVAIDGYVANTLSTVQILGIFTSTLTSILVPCFLLIRRVRPALSAAETATALWFVLCGVIHLGLEGMFSTFLLRPSVNPRQNKNGNNELKG